MTEQHSLLERIGAGSGILFVVLMIVGFGIVGEVSDELESRPAAEIARDYVDRSSDAEVGGIIQLFGLLAFFFFLAYFHRHLRNAEGEGGWLASVAYAGGVSNDWGLPGCLGNPVRD